MRQQLGIHFLVRRPFASCSISNDLDSFSTSGNLPDHEVNVACACSGLPKPRSSRMLAACTRAAGEYETIRTHDPSTFGGG